MVFMQAKICKQFKKKKTLVTKSFGEKSLAENFYQNFGQLFQSKFKSCCVILVNWSRKQTLCLGMYTGNISSKEKKAHQVSNWHLVTRFV